MSNKPRQQMKRRLENGFKKKLKRKNIQKQKRLLFRTDRTFPKCEKCGCRNKWNQSCKNCANQEQVES